MVTLTFVVLCATLLSQFCSAQELDEIDYESSGAIPQQCECPVHCSCTFDEIVCKSLDILPIEFQECNDWISVETLNITQNHLTALHAASFIGLPNLEKLHIDQNQINEIHEEAFVGLGSLTTLDLSFNNLRSIGGGHLHHLRSLKNLYLYSNNISSIADNDLKGLSSLELLSLDGNRITYLDTNAFQHSRNLTTILLYDNWITSLPNGLFNGLDKLVTLAIFNNYLESIDPRVFSGTPNLQRLYIQGNQISKISNRPFELLGRLRVLYMSDNFIDEISSNSLFGLTSLNAIVLTNNNISKIDDDAFSRTPVLQQIYMDDNKLEIISRQTFAPLRYLTLLRVGRNRLSIIEDGAFERHQYLYSLYLFENRIQNISNATFAGLYSLNEVVMNSNEITDLPEDMFRDSYYLKNLWINNNRIQCIKETTFRSQERLELLDLAQNEISYLPNNVFQYTPGLKYLILYSNRLSKITTRPFRNLPYLIQLAIYYNRITYIEEGAFDGTENLLFLQWNVVLDFDIDNALVCDCQALWFLNYLRTNQPYYASVYCGGPDYAQSEPIVAVEQMQDCSTELSVSLTPDSPVMYTGLGECVRIKCKPSQIGNVTWSLQGGDIRTSPHEECGVDIDQCGNEEDTTGFLTIAHFSEQDEGTYVCIVNGILLAQVNIILGDPPVIVKFPESKVYRDPPSYVVFACQAIGSPEPVVEWFHDDVKIEPTEWIHINQTGSLIILDASFADNGLYKAVASNGAGKVEVSAKLEIHFPSPCYGYGCENGGQCVSYHQCYCSEGHEGNRCEVPVSHQPDSSGDHPDYNYSGDYQNDYDYRDDEDGHVQERKKRMSRGKAKSSNGERKITHTTAHQQKAENKKEITIEKLEGLTIVYQHSNKAATVDVKPIDPSLMLQKLNINNVPDIDENDLKKLTKKH